MVLVTQELRVYIRERHVIRRVVRQFPHVPGGRRVEDQLVTEIATHPARRRLDPSTGGGHLRVVTFGSHVWSFDASPAGALAIALWIASANARALSSVSSRATRAAGPSSGLSTS